MAINAAVVAVVVVIAASTRQPSQGTSKSSSVTTGLLLQGPRCQGDSRYDIHAQRSSLHEGRIYLARRNRRALEYSCAKCMEVSTQVQH